MRHKSKRLLSLFFGLLILASVFLSIIPAHAQQERITKCQWDSDAHIECIIYDNSNASVAPPPTTVHYWYDIIYSQATKGLVFRAPGTNHFLIMSGNDHAYLYGAPQNNDIFDLSGYRNTPYANVSVSKYDPNANVYSTDKNTCSWRHDVDGCTDRAEGGTFSAAASAGKIAQISQQSGNIGAGAVADQKTCESQGALGWIMCPVINILDGVFNWLDTQIQALLEVNKDAYTSSSLHAAWQQFRNLAYIVLVPLILVMVISTAVGSGLFDAYTVKKALPRLVAAVLFVTLSWYICIFLIDLFNVLGGGVLGLITAPFKAAGNLSGNITLGDLFKPSLGGTAVQWAGMGGLVLLFSSVPGILGIIGSYLLVAVLIMSIAFLILVARQLFVLVLVLASPLAILAWIFPGSNRIWRFWHENFIRLLMMFPIIMALIASGRVFAYVTGNTPSGGLQGSLLNPLLKITAYIIPYALIPFTFRAAGTAFSTLTGMVNDRSKGVFDRLRNRRGQQRERVGRQVLQRRADWQNRLQAASSNQNRTAFGRLASRYGARAVGGYNVQAADAARRAAVGEEINKQIATGRDEEIRGLTVNKGLANQGAWETAARSDGNTYGDNGLRRRNKDGTLQYKTLGGAWVNEGAVDDGYRRWGHDTFAQQAALSYEMRKAATEDELQGIAQNYGQLATEGWGMTDNQAGGSWIGAAFENQNQHLEYKYTNWKDGSMSADQAKRFSTEIYEKRGSYPLAQMGSNTITQLKNAYDAGDETTKRQVQAVAESFMYRGGSRGIQGVEGDVPLADRRPPEASPPTGSIPGQTAPEAFFQTNTPGAAHVAENVRDLALHVGVYQGDLGSPRTASDQPPPGGPPGGPLPPPDIPRQN